MAQYSVATPMTLNGIATSYETAKLGLHKVIMHSAESIEDYVPRMFQKANFKQKQRKIKVYSGIPSATAWESTLGEIPTQGIQFLYDVTATHDWYAKATEYSLESKTFDEYDILKKMSTELGKSLGEKKQTIGADFFNDAFATAWSGDGQYFIDSDHPYDTRYSASTQSNVASGALSVSSIHDAINKIVNVKDPLGRPMNLKPKTLYCDYTQVILVNQLLGKNAEYGTANRNDSPFKNQNIDVVGYPWFDNTARWFLQANRTHTFYSQPVGFTTDVKETDAHGTKLEGWFALVVWAEMWQGWVGYSGA